MKPQYIGAEAGINHQVCPENAGEWFTKEAEYAQDQVEDLSK